MRPPLRLGMRWLTALAAAWACWAWPAPLAAAEPPTRAEILEQVVFLAHPEHREAARDWLLWHEEAATPVLKELFPRTPPGVQREITAILDAAAPAAAIAHHAQGLRLTLTANKTVIRPGETVTFTTTITNTLDVPLNLYLGYRTDNAPPAPGFAVRAGRNDPWEQAQQRPVLYAGGGACGTGVEHRFVVLPARGSVVSTTPAVFATAPPDMPAADLSGGQQPALYLLGDRRTLRLRAPIGAMHRFVATYAAGRLPPENMRHRWLGWDPTARVWQGRIMSDEVVITVAP